MRWSTCWSRVLKISFTTLPRYLKCLEAFPGNLADFAFFCLWKNDGTYHKSRDQPNGWNSGTRMGWAGDPLNLYHQSVSKFMSWFTHLCLRTWIIQNDPSFHNHGSVEKWMYLQYRFPFYLRVIFHFHDFLEKGYQKSEKNCHRRWMNRRVRSSSAWRRHTGSLWGCWLCEGDLLPGEIWWKVVEKKKIKMQKEKAEHQKSSKKKSWMGQDELVASSHRHLILKEVSPNFL